MAYIKCLCHNYQYDRTVANPGFTDWGTGLVTVGVKGPKTDYEHNSACNGTGTAKGKGRL